MIIKTFLEPPIDNNNYLIIDEDSKEAVLVDCSSFDKNVIDFLKKQDAKLKYILLTHGHFDHIGGVNELRTHLEYSGSEKPQVVMNRGDIIQLENANQYMSLFGMPDINVPEIDLYAEDGDILKFGNIDIKVIHTPGHTQGGVCYYIGENLFSGDTIFKECVGRCDLEGGDFVQIVENIQSKIFTLPDGTNIYPGHGSQTTVGWEKIHNKFA